MAIRSEKIIQRNENPLQGIVTVKVILMGELKRWAGRREVEIALPEGATIQMLTEKLGVMCGQTFVQNALTKKGAFQPHVAVFIDGVHMGELDSAQTVLLGEKVELMLLPSYEGG